jgi:putative ABC transport system permease protein
MRLLDMLRARVRALARSGIVDAELDDEMRGHLERLVDENIARGMTPAEARRAARLEFGPVTQLMEDARDARGVAVLVTLAQDITFGVRLMRRTPGFAAAAILTVALGIGATTAMFSVVYGVLLRSLPYGDADRLVDIWSTAPSRGLPRAYVAMANVYDYKARNHVFEDVAALRAIANFNLAGRGCSAACCSTSAASTASASARRR